jgi:hypothetical protein
VIASDLPGFGNTKAPPRAQFDYTFDALAQAIAGYFLAPARLGSAAEWQCAISVLIFGLIIAPPGPIQFHFPMRNSIIVRFRKGRARPEDCIGMIV